MIAPTQRTIELANQAGIELFHCEKLSCFLSEVACKKKHKRIKQFWVSGADHEEADIVCILCDKFDQKTIQYNKITCKRCGKEFENNASNFLKRGFYGTDAICKSCRSKKDTGRITSKTRIVMINGEKKSLAQWCREYKMKLSTVSMRIQRGWDAVRAIQTPVIKKGKKNAICKSNEKRRVRIST